MDYVVLVESPRGDRRDGMVQHRVMYRGPDEHMARQMAAHYTRPIDSLSAFVVQVATEADGVGWIGERVLT